MSPFSTPQVGHKPSLLDRLAQRRAVLAFGVCLLLGLVAVGWRVKDRAASARVQASAEARAQCTAVANQLNQAVAAAQGLAAMARQSGGAVPNFQKVAAELRSAWPGLAWLELQPGGIVNDVAPREGHERSIGLNVLKDPVQGPAALAALKTRALTATGPVALDGGEPGILVRAPIFQRTRDGREGFWGFVAATMPLSQAMSRANLDALAGRGYDYVFYSSGSGQQRAATFAALGALSLRNAVDEPVRVQNLEFRLAVQPTGGWISKTRVAVDCLGVAFVAGLVCLLVNVLESRKEVESALMAANQRAARETADRQKALEDFYRAKESAGRAQAELERTQLSLQEAQKIASDLQGRQEAIAREANQMKEAAQTRVAEAESRAAELGTAEAARANQAELQESRTILQQARQDLDGMQARLDAAERTHKEAAAAAQKRAWADQAAIADLQGRLDVVLRSAKETPDAGSARLHEAEENIRELRERLASAATAETRVGELTVLLQDAQADLARLREASTSNAHTSAEPERNGDPFPEQPAGSSEQPEPPYPQPQQVESPSAPALAGNEADLAPGSTMSASSGHESERISDVPEAVSACPGIETDEGKTTPATGLVPEPASPVTERKSETPSRKRRKARRDAQMSLFGEQSSEESEPAEPRTLSKPPLPREGPAPSPSALPPEAGDLSSRRHAEKPAPSRRLPAPPPVDPPELRKAVSQILPLLVDGDPGAKDCLKDNRETFRSAFAPEAYLDFEHQVKKGDYKGALEHLEKAARKHGISI